MAVVLGWCRFDTALDVSGDKGINKFGIGKEQRGKSIYNCVLLMETTISSLSAALQDGDICNTLLVLM